MWHLWLIKNLTTTFVDKFKFWNFWGFHFEIADTNKAHDATIKSQFIQVWWNFLKVVVRLIRNLRFTKHTIIGITIDLDSLINLECTTCAQNDTNKEIIRYYNIYYSKKSTQYDWSIKIENILSLLSQAYYSWRSQQIEQLLGNTKESVVVSYSVIIKSTCILLYENNSTWN